MYGLCMCACMCVLCGYMFVWFVCNTCVCLLVHTHGSVHALPEIDTACFSLSLKCCIFWDSLSLSPKMIILAIRLANEFLGSTSLHSHSGVSDTAGFCILAFMLHLEIWTQVLLLELFSSIWTICLFFKFLLNSASRKYSDASI